MRRSRKSHGECKSTNVIRVVSSRQPSGVSGGIAGELFCLVLSSSIAQMPSGTRIANTELNYPQSLDDLRTHGVVWNDARTIGNAIEAVT